jgi:hypothetical protein
MARSFFRLRALGTRLKMWYDVFLTWADIASWQTEIYESVFVSTNFGPAFSRVIFRAGSNFRPHKEKSNGLKLRVWGSEADCCSEIT